MRLHPTLSLLATLLACTLSAQDRAPEAAVARAMTACAVESADDAVVGLGPDYELRCDRDGVTFLPLLGKRAPRNLPLGLRLRAVHRGGIATPFAAVAPAASDHAIEYRRGAFVERYDVREDGVEQSFVFAARPAGHGDLVVELQLQTELRGEDDAEGGARFRFADVGGVRVGGVTGIDAAGSRTAGTVRVAGDRLELALPAAFVDGARYPLTLDPLLGTAFQIAIGTSNDDGEPDVAYDATTGNYLVVWRRAASVTGTAIRAIRIDGSGALVGNLIGLTDSSQVHVAPRVANVNLRDRFLVVWRQAATAFGPFEVVARSVAALDGALSATVSLVSAADETLEHCVSGEATTLDDEAIVVWRTGAGASGNGIQAAQITLPSTGDPVPGAPVTVTGSGGPLNPCISRNGGPLGRHLIVWSRLHATGLDLRAQAYTRDLVPIGAELTVTADTVTDTQPSVDGDGSGFLVVWNRDGDIHGQLVLNNGAVTTIQTPPFPIEADAGQDESRPDVAYLGLGRWCAVWSEAGASFDDDVAGAILEGNGTRCSVELTFPGADRTPDHRRETTPRVVGRYAGAASGASDEGLVVFAESSVLPPFDGDIIGQRVESIGQGGAVTTIGRACGFGGTGRVAGPFALGNPDFGFELTGADPVAPLCFLGLAFPGPTSTCGSCQFMQPLALEFRPIAGGNASSPFPLPCDPVYLGTQLEFQWFTFGGSSTQCPLAPGLAASGIVRATLGQ